MRRALAIAALAGLAAGCGAIPRGAGPRPAADARLVLYRDGALVEEDVVVEVGPGPQRVTVPVARGLGAGEVEIISDDVRVRGWTVAGGLAAGAPVEVVRGGRTASGTVRQAGEGPLVIDAGGGAVLVDEPELITGVAAPALVVDVEARRPGRARLVVRYLTGRLAWRASYTLIAHGARGRLHGALGLDNRTGRRWPRATLAVVDRNRPTAPPAATTAGERPTRVPGVVALEPGPQQLDLALRETTLALAPTLVYDPVGPSLDSATMRPQLDEDYGVARWPAAVDESLKIDLAQVSDGPLPAGAIRVFTAGAGGELVWRGEGRLLPRADDAERYTTVAVGRSPDVTGRRKRTDFFVDLGGMRLIEEYTITIANRGARAADVLVREHLYRGQCWTLAYHSTGDRVAKEGAQQIGLGVAVPAAGEATVMYRVLYEWDERKCRASTSKP